MTMMNWMNSFASMLCGVTDIKLVKLPSPICCHSSETLPCSYLIFTNSRPWGRLSGSLCWWSVVIHCLSHCLILVCCPGVQSGLPLRLFHWTIILCLIDLWISFTLIPNDSQPFHSALPSLCQLMRHLSVCLTLWYLFIKAFPLCTVTMMAQTERKKIKKNER